MTEDSAWRRVRGSSWQLLFEFRAPGCAPEKGTTLPRIAAVVDGLGVHSPQKERIAQSVAGALAGVAQRNGRDGLRSSVCVRVWAAGVPPAEAQSGSGLAAFGLQPGNGWGFFLLDRQDGTLDGEGGEAGRVLDLYLYREATGAR